MVKSLANSGNICRWQRRKEDRPAEILAAALQIFSEKGFAATKLDDVAREAGVSKGTLYLYFESKEVLLKEVVNEFVLPHIISAETEAANYSGSIQALIRLLVAQMRSKILETELCGIPKLIISEATNFPELAEFYLEKVIQRGRKFIAGLIQMGIESGEFQQCDTEYVARSLLSTLVFVAIWQRSLAPFDESYDMEHYLNTHLDIFLRGIAKDNNA